MPTSFGLPPEYKKLTIQSVKVEFFGLSKEYPVQLHEEIFTLFYHGQGGFIHSDVYHLPIHLRRFYLKVLYKMKKSESDQIESSSKAAKNSAKVSRPPTK